MSQKDFSKHAFFDSEVTPTVGKIGWELEKTAISQGFSIIAGIDEVGRGCLAGPVVAAACILDPAKRVPDGLNDSKKLTPNSRRRSAEELKLTAKAWAIGIAGAEEIDRVNILEATKLAMQRAIESLSIRAEFLLIDSVKLKGIGRPFISVNKGDELSFSIAAASVIAKTFRDQLMAEMDKKYPGYGFAKHFGYGTKMHLEAIKKNGPTEIHRMTFRRVKPSTQNDYLIK